MHRSWMSLHSAGTSTPISASLLRRVFKLHLLPIPALILAFFFVGEEIFVVEPGFSTAMALVSTALGSAAVAPQEVSLAGPQGAVESMLAEAAVGKLEEAGFAWSLLSSPRSSLLPPLRCNSSRAKKHVMNGTECGWFIARGKQAGERSTGRGFCR